MYLVGLPTGRYGTIADNRSKKRVTKSRMPHRHQRSALLVFAALAGVASGWPSHHARTCRPPQESEMTRFSTNNRSNNSEDSGSTSSSLPTGWIKTKDLVQMFGGAGEPRPALAPEEIPTLLMTALCLNDDPYPNAGLESMWQFAGGATQHIFKNNMADFIDSAHQTANEFPTSFYGVAFYGQSWEMETDLNRVGGDAGWIATQVMKTVTSDGRVRRWQWELRKNKRPPCLGCWKVESVASSDRNGNFESE